MWPAKGVVGPGAACGAYCCCAGPGQAGVPKAGRVEFREGLGSARMRTSARVGNGSAGETRRARGGEPRRPVGELPVGRLEQVLNEQEQPNRDQRSAQSSNQPPLHRCKLHSRSGTPPAVASDRIRTVRQVDGRTRFLVVGAQLVGTAGVHFSRQSSAQIAYCTQLPLQSGICMCRF